MPTLTLTLTLIGQAEDDEDEFMDRRRSEGWCRAGAGLVQEGKACLSEVGLGPGEGVVLHVGSLFFVHIREEPWSWPGSELTSF